MTYEPIYEPPERQPQRRQRSTLDSPALSAALVIVVLGLVAAVVFLPGILSPSGPNASGRPSGAPTEAGPSVAPTFVRPTPSPAPTFLTYTVRPGDTLNSIAREFRTSGRSIAWWNRATYPSLDPLSEGYEPNTIRVGWVLLLMPDTIVDDANPPSLPPGASAGPGGTPGSSPVAGPATEVAHGPRSVSNIALTFDMAAGWTRPSTLSSG